MFFKERTTLKQTSVLVDEQLEDRKLDSILLVGEEFIFRWEDEDLQFGPCQLTIQPAYYERERCWLQTRVRGSSPKHNLVCESIIEEKEGLEVLSDAGYFDDMFALTEVGEDRLTEEEKKLVNDGKWVTAIRDVRRRTKLSLRESKNLVDRYREQRRIWRFRWHI
jgi:hypothetical protein